MDRRRACLACRSAKPGERRVSDRSIEYVMPHTGPYRLCVRCPYHKTHCHTTRSRSRNALISANNAATSPSSCRGTDEGSSCSSTAARLVPRLYTVWICLCLNVHYTSRKADSLAVPHKPLGAIPRSTTSSALLLDEERIRGSIWAISIHSVAITGAHRQRDDFPSAQSVL